MNDQQYVIDFAESGRGIVQPDDRDWLDAKLRREPGATSLNVAPDDLDTEGHGQAGGTAVRVIVADDDDTEGHAISIHFPSTAEADAFRKRLMVAGVLAGTVALGAAGGMGLANLSNSDAGAGAVIESGVTGSAWTQDERRAAATEATPGSAWTQDERPGTAAAAAQTGPLDVHEAPAFEGLSAADQAYADRLSGQAAAAQTGPLDVHEAPAFEGLSAADQAYADRLSGQAAATQTGPMDVHEAPAFQNATTQTGPMDVHEAPAFQNATTQTGPMDVHEAPAFQNAASGEDDAADSGTPSIGGPTPR